MNNSLFRILGPIMVGPSSSHTAGAVRIGRMCRSVARQDVKSVTFFLHGSFEKTYKGHGTDRALVGGILGMDTDDERIINALDIAKAHGISFKFVPANLGNVHPNTVKAEITNSKGENFNVIASSIGGGQINVLSVNGFLANISGQYNSTIIKHLDKIGLIRKIASVFEKCGTNIVSLHADREDRGKTATTIVEFDGKINPCLIENLPLIDGVSSVSFVDKI